MVSLKECIDDKYGEKENESDDFDYIVFVSCSPEAKRGLLPPLMTLNDYNIECFGDFSDLSSKIRHIRELDLTDNLLSDWSEVMDILTSFKSLTFLNLSNNLLNESLDNANVQVQKKLDNSKIGIQKVTKVPSSVI
jgi:Leucine-rich repeat (LRR) protein